MTPSKGKDSDSSDSGKTLFLCFDLSVDFFIFFPSPSSVVVDFIGTKKSTTTTDGGKKENRKDQKQKNSEGSRE